MEMDLVKAIQRGVQTLGQWYRGNRLLRIGCWVGVSLLVLVVAGRILINSWLIPKALKEMTHSLASAGLHLRAEEADLELLKGRIALEGLTLFHTAEREEPVLFLSGTRIEIDLKQLIFDRTFWGEAQIRDGTLIFFGKEHHTEYGDLNVDLDLSTDALRLHRFEGTGLGYQVATTGLLRWGSGEDDSSAEADSSGDEQSGETNPAPDEAIAAGAADSPYPDFPADLDWMESLSELFSCETTGEEPAQLTLAVEWDQTKPIAPDADGSVDPSSQLKVEGSVDGRDVIWLNLPLESINSSFTIEDGLVKIPHAKFVGMGGEFNSAGVYDLATSNLTFHSPVSTMNPILLLGNLGVIDPAEWPVIDFGSSMPELAGDELRIDFEELAPPVISLSIDAPGGFRFREHPESEDSILVDSFGGTVQFQRPGELLVKGVKTRAGGLDIDGQFLYRWDAGADPDPAGAGQPASVGEARAPAGSPQPAKAEPEATSSLTRMANHLLTFESTGGALPTCSLDIVWDSTLQQPSINPVTSSATGRGKFSGAAFKWHDHVIGRAVVEVEFDDQLLKLSQLEFNGLGGTLNASGEFDLEERTAAIPAIDSSLDLAELKSNLGIQLIPILDSLSFPSPPDLIGRNLEIHLDHPAENLGKIGLVAEDGFTLGHGEEALTTDALKLTMDWKAAGELAVEEASAKIGGLQIETSGTLRWKAAGAEDGSRSESGEAGAPAPDAPTQPDEAPEDRADELEIAIRESIAWIRDWINVSADGAPLRLATRFEWDQHRIKGGGPKSQPSALAGLSLEGDLSGGNCIWRNFPIERIQSKFTMRDGRIDFAPFDLQTKDGKILARGSYAPSQDSLRLDSVRLNVHLQSLLREFEGDSPGLLTVMEFPSTPELEGRNLSIDLADSRQSRGSINARFPQGIKLLSEPRPLLLQDVQGTFRLQNGVVTTDNLQADILEGNARVNFRAAISGASPWYDTSVSIKDVSMGALNRWLVPGDTKSHKGNFDLQFSGKGVDSFETLVGNGRVIVDSEEPTAQNFPILDGLIGFLEGLIPVLQKSKIWTLDLPFTIKKSVIYAVEAKVKGPSIDLNLNGQLDLNTELVDVGVGVNLRGLLGITTGLLTFFRENLVDITGTGKLGAIKWEKARRATPKPPPANPGGSQKRKRPGIFDRR